MLETEKADALNMLNLPTATLMSAGGDDRITLDEQSGLNSYGCAPEPIRAISYSSSTASAISAAAFAHAHTVHHQLRQRSQGTTAEALYTQFLRQARTRIRALYQLDQRSDVTDIAFGASGTDLEYLALAAALQSGQPVTNLVVEVDEVGSGCLFSQAGHYFADRTALGHDVEKGAFLNGFSPQNVQVETLKTRSDAGPVLDEAAYAALLQTAAAEAIAAGRRPLVHIIHRSKTGIITPSLATIDALIAAHGDAIDLVVDACQGRISPAAINAYLDRGAMVFLTGSKFIGGPPFSAWALVPDRVAQRMTKGALVVPGLAHFFARGDMPIRWAACDGVLPPDVNFGLLLRLEAGLFELQRLMALPQERVDAVIAAFGAAMRGLSPDRPFCLIEGAADDPSAGDHLCAGHAKPEALDRKMLFVIAITQPHPGTGQPLSFEEARAVYRFLYADMSASQDHATDQQAAAEIIHLGQPVKCLKNQNGQTDAGEWAPTLRLSLSAPQIFDMVGLDGAGLKDRFAADLDRIAAKIKLAVQHAT
jgi:hypothetical protein